MPEGALSEVKVVDLTQHVAGPFATKLFADYGAEVIKVERPGQGDVSRAMGPFPGDIPHPEKSGLFLHLNTNKKSVTLNLKTVTGRKVLKELVKDADILVESYPPKVAESLGVSYDEMAQANPNLVMASITSFGQYGPYRDFKATDMIIQALAGTQYICGVPDREPQKVGNYANLFLGGSTAAGLIMSALWGAKFHGLGQHVDISLMEAAAGSMDRGGTNLLALAYTGDYYFQRASDRRTSLVPSGHIPCKDGFVCCNASPRWWADLCQVIDRPDLTDDPYFTSNMYNPDAYGDFDVIFVPWLADYGKQEIMEKAQARGVPITAINSIEEVFRDPQLRFRGYFTEVEHPVAGKFEYPGAPFKMMETPWQAGRAPLLGEHTEEVLCGRLGYSREDLTTLRQQGII